jgi:hypothetical protein
MPMLPAAPRAAPTPLPAVSLAASAASAVVLCSPTGCPLARPAAVPATKQPGLLSGFHKGRAGPAGGRCPRMQRRGSGADLAPPQCAPFAIATPPPPQEIALIPPLAAKCSNVAQFLRGVFSSFLLCIIACTRFHARASITPPKPPSDGPPKTCCAPNTAERSTSPSALPRGNRRVLVNNRSIHQTRRQRQYGWTGQQSSSGFCDLAPLILHYNWF